ncbi:MAG: hypothetical protein R2876_03775 [Eubacteriales bacterium]
MRRFLFILSSLFTILALSACSYQLQFPVYTEQITPTYTQQTAAQEYVTDQQTTLDFTFGQRTGTYTGSISNGLPNGYGSFYCMKSDDSNWTYEGYWVNGHLSGQGKTTWDDGFVETGLYQNDALNGEGKEYFKDVLQYEGYYEDGTFNGQGTLYDYHGKVIFSGNFEDGFIQETFDQRYERLYSFKYESIEASYPDIYNSALYENNLQVKVSGTVFYVYEYWEDEEYYCNFLIYDQGVEDSNRIISVSYWMSKGESKVYEGQYVSVWGSTAYLYSYTSVSEEYLTVPLIYAWSVE